MDGNGTLWHLPFAAVKHCVARSGEMCSCARLLGETGRGRSTGELTCRWLWPLFWPTFAVAHFFGIKPGGEGLMRDIPSQCVRPPVLAKHLFFAVAQVYGIKPAGGRVTQAALPAGAASRSAQICVVGHKAGRGRPPQTVTETSPLSACGLTLSQAYGAHVISRSGQALQLPRSME